MTSPDAQRPAWKPDLAFDLPAAGAPIPQTAHRFLYDVAHLLAANGARQFEPAWLRGVIQKLNADGLAVFTRPLSSAQAARLAKRLTELRAVLDNPALYAALEIRQARSDAEDAEEAAIGRGFRLH